jgi:hypothetical protein
MAAPYQAATSAGFRRRAELEKNAGKAFIPSENSGNTQDNPGRRHRLG